MTAKEPLRMWGVPAPPPHVEMIRDWFTPAYHAWSKAIYPPRTGFWIAGGCLLWFIVIPFIVAKALLFWTVVLVMLLIAFFTIGWDLATYRHRLNALR